MGEQAASKGVSEEQTATLETALLHGHDGLSCGPRYEPLSGAPFQSRGLRTIRATQGQSSLPAAGLTLRQAHDRLCHLHLPACCLLREDFVVSLACPHPGAAEDSGVAGLTLTCRASNASPRVVTAHTMRAFLSASATMASGRASSGHSKVYAIFRPLMSFVGRLIAAARNQTLTIGTF